MASVAASDRALRNQFSDLGRLGFKVFKLETCAARVPQCHRDWWHTVHLRKLPVNKKTARRHPRELFGWVSSTSSTCRRPASYTVAVGQRSECGLRLMCLPLAVCLTEFNNEVRYSIALEAFEGPLPRLAMATSNAMQSCCAPDLLPGTKTGSRSQVLHPAASASSSAGPRWRNSAGGSSPCLAHRAAAPTTSLAGGQRRCPRGRIAGTCCSCGG
jgi:hypothetical protein